MTEEQPASRQGRFWRRALALTIDTLIVSVAIAAVGITLSLSTGGRIRAGEAFISQVECFKLDRSYPEITLPQGFKPTATARCVRSFLGRSYDWYLFVQRKIESGAVSYVTNLTYPLDPGGAVARPIYLDNWLFVLLVVSIFIQEWKEGKTLGKRAMGLRVQSLGSEPRSGRQIATRLLRFAYLVPMQAAYAVGSVTALFAVLGLGALIAAITVGELLLAIRRGQVPFYDRMAGTEVVRAGR